MSKLISCEHWMVHECHVLSWWSWLSTIDDKSELFIYFRFGCGVDFVGFRWWFLTIVSCSTSLFLMLFHLLRRNPQRCILGVVVSDFDGRRWFLRSIWFGTENYVHKDIIGYVLVVWVECIYFCEKIFLVSNLILIFEPYVTEWLWTVWAKISGYLQWSYLEVFTLRNTCRVGRFLL